MTQAEAERSELLRRLWEAEANAEFSRDIHEQCRKDATTAETGCDELGDKLVAALNCLRRTTDTLSMLFEYVEERTSIIGHERKMAVQDAVSRARAVLATYLKDDTDAEDAG